MKMKEFGPPGGGARPWRPPLDPPMLLYTNLIGINVYYYYYYYYYQELSDQRREIHIRTWLKKITTRRKVNVNLNKPTKRVVSTC